MTASPAANVGPRRDLHPPSMDVVAKTDHAAAAPSGPPGFVAAEDIRAGDALYQDPSGKLWRVAPGKTGAELLTEATAELESAMGDLEAQLNEVRERIGAVVAVLDQTTIVAPAPDPKAT